MSDVSQGHGWWQADNGKWYAPERHPDYKPLSLPPPPPPPPPTAKPTIGPGTILAICVGSLLVFGMVWAGVTAAWRAAFETPCQEARRELKAAKAERVEEGLSDPRGIIAVSDAAQEARRKGCNIDDLVAPSVGTTLPANEPAECADLRNEWQLAYERHRQARAVADAEGRLTTMETQHFNEMMAQARQRGEAAGCVGVGG